MRSRHAFSRRPISIRNIRWICSRRRSWSFHSGRATFDCGFELPYRCDYEVVGSKGRIICPNAILPGEAAELLIEANGKMERETFPGVNQWSLEFEHLSRCIADGTPLEYDCEDAIKQQRVIDTVYRSARSGQFETV